MLWHTIESVGPGHSRWRALLQSESWCRQGPSGRGRRLRLPASQAAADSSSAKWEVKISAYFAYKFHAYIFLAYFWQKNQYILDIAYFCIFLHISAYFD